MKAEAKPTVKAAEKKDAAGTVVYIGPTFPGIAKQNTIYNNGIPAGLARKAKEKPVVASLIVPVSQFAAASAELVKDGSALSILYKKAKE